MSEFKILTGAEGLEKIGDLISGIRIAMMSTVGEDGSIDSRPMATQHTQFDGTLWFLTPKDSLKVSEVKEDSHVSLTYADAGKAIYVSLKGRGQVSSNHGKIEELWNPMYQAWFPDGVDDPRINVLRVDVSEAEYWEASSSSIVRAIKYVAAAATKGAVDVGEYGKVLV